MCNKLRGFILGWVFLIAAGVSWAATPPPNDHFSDRIVLMGNSITFTGVTAGATMDLPHEFYWQAFGYSVWWSWTATETAPVILQILQASKPPNFSGSGWDALNVWHPQDVSLGFPTNFDYPQRPVAAMVLDAFVVRPSITFTGVVGETYQIQLTSVRGTEYVISLTATNSPIIIEQPKSQTVSEGASALLAVAATGVLPLLYQWRLDGVDLPGETYPMAVFKTVTTNQAGAYSVVISNATGVCTSEVANLYVTLADVRPALGMFTLAASNRFEFTLNGEIGRYYRIESSTNLVDWSPEKTFPMRSTPFPDGLLTSVVFCSNGVARFSVPAGTNRKFVRAARYFAPNEICNLNLKQIRFAKALYARDYFRISTEYTLDRDIVPYMRYGKWLCPLGGVNYTGGPHSALPTCSFPGHVLEEP